ncbi:amino acid ABC transporter ATP-binding protein [Oceanibaculum indicum]|uniref:Polar amino acid transport system ATP-binding protein n=1 Tax=Oceanibaculum indicum TaxID=526216 RepID=A0A420WR36_9PROT|nr:ATP-binding cassette domain-containing protein [Oceanibaculum indicum]RKQ73508.1 polar amino acid transport system ATP-binding protein [Oceanibaculum indicum]
MGNTALATETVTTAAIRFEDVSKHFGETPVLEAVSFSVLPGQVVCIAGPSGTGKTTLLRLVNALTPADQGHIQAGPFNVTQPGTDLQALRRYVGMVFQRYSLFPHKSVLENLTMGPRQVLRRPRAEAEEQAIDLLARLEVAELRERYPGELSAGQQQRVALVRALTMDPKILLLDEVTAALDPRMVDKVAELIRQMAATGMTILASSHDMRFATLCADLLAQLDRGRLGPLQPPPPPSPAVEP